MNEGYTIPRRAILKALGLPDKIPVDLTRPWTSVVVPTGWLGDGPPIAISARVVPRGVANRVRVVCPLCATEVRFSVLQQHAGSGRCKARADAAAARCTTAAEPEPDNVRREVEQLGGEFGKIVGLVKFCRVDETG